MYSVEIVEDEMLVRLGLRNSIDWEKFDMKVIADAENGQTAWEIFQSEKPDIVITDIRMPVMDGMTLIEKIRGVTSGTKIIILTCIEEFEMARKAMSYGVSEYILKLTMSVEDIEKVLDRIKDELDNERGTTVEDEIEKVGNDVIKERLLKGFLFYDLFTKNQFVINKEKCGVKFGEKNLLLSIIAINNYEIFKEKFQDEEGKTIILSILNMLNDLLKNNDSAEAFYNDGGQFILIMNYNPDFSEDPYFDIKPFLKNIREMLDIYFKVSAVFGISNPYSGYENLTTMYHEAEEALKLKFYMGTEKLLVPKMPVERIGQNTLEKIRNLDGIESLLGKQCELMYESKIDLIIESVKEPDEIKKSLCKMIQWIGLNIYSEYSFDVTEQTQSFTHIIDNAETLCDCISAFPNFIREIGEKVRQKNIYSTDISNAIKYIHQNFKNNVTLNDVASYINMSPSYFSNLFKKETNVNFIEYLNKYRVERAKKLLLTTDCKAYEIAEKVGFSENTYFCKVFKKITTMSPNEFRKNNIQAIRTDKNESF